MLLLGVLQAQAAGAVGAGSFDLLETQVLASSAASVTFSSLSTYAADYKHLQIRAVVRDTSTNAARLGIRYNSDSATNYSYHVLFGRGSTVNSTSGTSTNLGWIMLETPASGFTANAFGATVVDILDPFESTKYTTTRALGGYGPSGGNEPQSIALLSSSWRNTNSVTDIQVFSTQGVALAANSRISLYGIKAGA